MASYTIDKSQRTAARVAGFMYLFTMAAANFVEFYVRRHVVVHGDAVQTAQNIAASSGLFRLGIASDLITLACDVVLVAALYVILTAWVSPEKIPSALPPAIAQPPKSARK